MMKDAREKGLNMKPKFMRYAAVMLSFFVIMANSYPKTTMAKNMVSRDVKMTCVSLPDSTAAKLRTAAAIIDTHIV